MLEAMRQLSLDYLFREIGSGNPPSDLTSWLRDLRSNSPELLFPFLVEDSEKINELFVIEPDQQESNIVNLSSQDMLPETASQLPFMRPSGSQSAQVGPVIKRSYSKQKGAGPSPKIIKTTIESFREIAQAGEPWSPYFKEINSCLLERPLLRLPDQSIVNWVDEGFSSLLEAAISLMGEKNQTVFLSVADGQGKLPGRRREYMDYLMFEKLGGARYTTDKISAQLNSCCSLCGVSNVTIYPNAIKGAGINIGNMDREGAFPGINLSDAWKGYSLCLDCADLLYVYKNHCIKQNPVTKKRPFIAPVGGDLALVIPHSNSNSAGRQELLQQVYDYVRDAASHVGEKEETILEILKDQRVLLNLTFLWADVGQNIENLRGAISDVPPSRLKTLSEKLDEQMAHPLFPDVRLYQLEPDLSLSALRALFKRPGGKKAKDANNSQRLFQLRRNLAECVYKSVPVQQDRFWSEVITTARWHWKESAEQGNSYSLLNEGLGKKEPFLTAAGWCRYLALWIYYFRKLEVMEMPDADASFRPSLKELMPYFGPESGIDSPQKAYAFLLGVLYGKVLQVQGARGVNVGANALTWLKRLTLTGRDLPHLYIKVREKLLAYETEKSAKVRDLLEELGELGVRIGDRLDDLDDTATCYYLLLGQSLSNKILAKDKS